MDLETFYTCGVDHFLPNLSIDIVIIGYRQGELQCLLLRIGDKWLLPGGYIARDESVDRAATRIMKDRTGLRDPHLKFLTVFGDPGRRFGKEWKEFVEKSGMVWQDGLWVNDRFVTLTYYSLVHMEGARPSVGNLDREYEWFSFDALPAMWMDHKDIVVAARERLKEDVRHDYVTPNLLPERFTMPDLHGLHQTILEEKLERSRFQKKMLSTGLFERLPELQKDAPGRNPYQYRFKSD